MTDMISVGAPTAQPGNPTTPSAPAPVTRPSANVDPAPAGPNKGKKGLRSTTAFTSSSVGIDPLLNVVANVNVSTPQRLDTNYFTANAQAYFQAVSITDQSMAMTKKFLDSTESWHFTISHYHACLLWHLQLFRTYEKSGVPDVEGKHFLDWFETHIDLKNIPVPGSWAPYLKALTVCEAHHESYGNVAPLGVPITMANVALDTAYSYPEVIARNIPNPLLALDQLRAYSEFNPGNNNDPFIIYRNLFGRPISGANGQAFFPILLTPHASSWSSQSRTRQTVSNQFWRDNRSILPQRLPHTAPAQGSTSIDNYFKLFGFQNLDNSWNMRFIQTFLNDMSIYCQFVKGSVPLSTIDVVGLGAGIPRNALLNSSDAVEYIYPTAAQMAANRHTAGHRTFPMHSLFHMEHGDLTLDTVGEQYGMSTLVNLDLSRVTRPTGSTWARITPRLTIDGPFWDTVPMRRNTGFNPILGLATVIPAYYHATTPVTPKT
uniref:Coat protein n=1 Tax=Rhizoctonia solani virus Rs31 TaxID=3232014 RepID=A0AAU8MIV4_9VIRU